MIKYLGDCAGVFDADQIRLMGAALNEAWTTLREGHAAYTTDNEAESTRYALAKWIIEAAKGGELDPHRLSEGALLDLVGTIKL